MIEKGTRVRYSRDWLRNTGQFTGPEAPTSWGPFARGTVWRIIGPVGNHVAVRVQWENGEHTSVLSANLELLP